MIPNNNAELFTLSKQLVPGGVHSPVRSFKGLHTTPRFVKKASGASFEDIEGKNYIDFCMSFGPLILGHKNEVVEKELVNALSRGWSFGACEPYSVELLQFLTSKLPHIEMMRFVNSGTEAVMTALRLARGVTKRDKIIKFNGCFHGHVDSMLIKAGSGLAGTAEASSAGVTKGIANDTLVVDLDDKDAVRACFRDHKDQIAAIIIEPLPANNGLLIQTEDFLKFLREICNENKSLLIFDEVISGFRVAFGGMAEITKIKPDIVTYGKIIGGGMPVGAIGSSKFIMEHLAPIGPVYQAGTLSANPLAMVAGLATLKQMTPEAYSKLHSYTEKIVGLFDRFLKTYNNGEFKEIVMVHYGSLFWLVPHHAVKKIGDIPSDLSEKFYNLFKVMLDRGIYLAPNAYEVGFVSLAHDDEVVSNLEKRLFN